MPKPLIGIAPAYNRREDTYWHMVRESYSQAVWKAGGLPLILTYPDSPEGVKVIARQIGGLLLIGGPDLPVEYYGGQKYDLKGNIPMHMKRVTFDKQTFELFSQLDKPILAICAGLQHINVIHGGSLYEDIATFFPDAINHGDYKGPVTYHPVRVDKDTLLYRVLGEKTFEVSSTHHQGIKKLGEGLKASAKTADGLIEAIEYLNGETKFIGVQWHPELMQDDPLQMKLFRWVVEEAKYESKKIQPRRR